ncbi:[acyl-carrier-protein] S-malonyltransferase [Aureococcus anophagefferens]|nr:[acyl-carrier-protein] S-malonyltransferase [Aureococcus anophagefferens]
MDKWFPQLKQTKCGADARLRLVTFPNSGSAENVYTGADKTAFGGASGRRDNELMVWAKKTKVEVYAAQPPGRDTRMRECRPRRPVRRRSSRAACPAIFAHSMGTWVAYEFCLARAKGHPAPTVLVDGQAALGRVQGMSDDEFRTRPAAGLGLERGHERLQRQRPIKGHHLFVYDEPARDLVQGRHRRHRVLPAHGALKSYLCTAKKGAAVRAGCELSTAQVQPEIDNGWLVDVSEEQENSRARAGRAETRGGRRRGAVTAFAGTTATMHTVTGKNGAMMRAGCELDTPELGVTLEQGTECYAVEEANAKGSLRSRIVCYTANGSPYAAIDGWCTAKFLTVVDKTKGAQKVGMLAPYADTPGVKAMFKEASKIFGCDLLELVEKGPVEKLNDTRFSQVCVFLTSMAAVKKLQREDPKAVNKCAATAGFSLGEYSALTFAGVMELDTALTLLKIRGDAMGAACDLAPSGMMTVVGLDDDALKMMPEGDVESIKAKMCEQLMAGVLWEDTINDMAKRFPDVDNFYEPAPGRQLTSMMRRIEPKNQPKMKNAGSAPRFARPGDARAAAGPPFPRARPRLTR